MFFGFLGVMAGTVLGSLIYNLVQWIRLKRKAAAEKAAALPAAPEPEDEQDTSGTVNVMSTQVILGQMTLLIFTSVFAFYLLLSANNLNFPVSWAAMMIAVKGETL